MMKNRYLAKEIASEKFYEFRRQMEYKCEPYGIQLVFAWLLPKFEDMLSLRSYQERPPR